MKSDDTDPNSKTARIDPNTVVYNSNISHTQTLMEPSHAQFDTKIEQSRVSDETLMEPELSRVMEKKGVERKGENDENGEVGVGDNEAGGFRWIGDKCYTMRLLVDLSPRVSAQGEMMSGKGMNLVVDLSSRASSHGEFKSGNGNGGKGIEGNEFSDGFGDNTGDCNNNENILNGNQGFNEERGGYEDEKDVETNDLEELRDEKEGEYYVSDLVWGKVKSYPWWPGQIFEPSAASEKARKHFKKDSYLIAYFGDGTFAWNEASHIKPFRMHFSHMEKQSGMKAFCHAVDCALEELSRRVEFGLACSCLSEEEYAMIKTQVVVNTGICEESSRRDGGDDLSGATSYIPAKLVQYLKELARAPLGEINRLKFAIARAQLRAFNHWKGYYLLPAVKVSMSVEEKDSDEVIEDAVPGSEGEEQAPSGKIKSVSRHGSSRKHKHISDDGVSLSKKKRSMTDLMSGSSSSLQNSGGKYEKKDGGKMISLSSCKKRRAVDSVSNNSTVESKKSHLSPVTVSKMSSPPKELHKFGERLRRAASQLGDSTPILKSRDETAKKIVAKHGGELGKSSGSEKSRKREKVVPAQYPPAGEMLAELCLASREPMNGYSSLILIASFFSDFRNSICLENSSSQKDKKSIEKVSGKQKGKKSSNLENTVTPGVDGIEDSYWTDMIIQSNPDEQVLFELETPTEKSMPTVEPESAVDIRPNSDYKQDTTDGVIESEETEPAGHIKEEHHEYFPTALILNFRDLESVPSIADLNKIFRRYGPLNESETEVLNKSKRAKVVFKKCFDADTAFSSSGKFGIFGPSLVSYSLKYLSTPRKASTPAPKRNRKDTTFAEGN